MRLIPKCYLFLWDVSTDKLLEHCTQKLQARVQLRVLAIFVECFPKKSTLNQLSHTSNQHD